VPAASSSSTSCRWPKSRTATKQRTSAKQQQEEAQQRETRQVLNRLRDLAQRQEDLNKQMKELESALQKANDQAQREELKRQLARLRDQQQQLLRDTDELRDRTQRPENQERMADTRQQLDQTRDNVRKAAEALNNQQPQLASAAGQRAAEQLNKLKEEVRKTAAGQFNDAMTEMRKDARDLEKKQQDLSNRLTNLDAPKSPEQQKNAGLRDAKTNERQQITGDLGKQRQDLEKLLDNMKKTIEQAETAEPLLSKQLYDTVRQTHQQQTDKALDASKELLDKGLLEDARKNGNVITGGSAMDRPGYFIEPTIVRDIKEGSRLVDEEQFGPVLPVIKYSDKDDVIRRANATTYGLGASVWSSDTRRAHEVAQQIEAGTVWINKHLDMAPHIPFGGAKQSGIGTEFAEEGLAEFTQLQIINGPAASA